MRAHTRTHTQKVWKDPILHQLPPTEMGRGTYTNQPYVVTEQNSPPMFKMEGMGSILASVF